MRSHYNSTNLAHNSRHWQSYGCPGAASFKFISFRNPFPLNLPTKLFPFIVPTLLNLQPSFARNHSTCLSLNLFNEYITDIMLCSHPQKLNNVIFNFKTSPKVIALTTRAFYGTSSGVWNWWGKPMPLICRLPSVEDLRDPLSSRTPRVYNIRRGHVVLIYLFEAAGTLNQSFKFHSFPGARLTGIATLQFKTSTGNA